LATTVEDGFGGRLSGGVSTIGFDGAAVKTSFGSAVGAAAAVVVVVVAGFVAALLGFVVFGPPQAAWARAATMAKRMTE
jgi:UPF0716 family protein affecting phage T7 exclusion